MEICLWFNLLRKTVIIATFYFAVEKIVCVRKKMGNCKYHEPHADASFYL